MTDLELHLLNDFQRDFPLVPAPFGVIAGRLGASEAEVLKRLNQLQACGKVSRVGAVFRPHSIGSSTLAALAVPVEELDEIAQLVSSYAEVNHNYEREHRYNLWFVVTASEETRVQEVLNEIEHRTGYQPLNLPMLEDFHIDLGFDLSRPHKGGSTRTVGRVLTRQVGLKPDLRSNGLSGLKPSSNLLSHSNDDDEDCRCNQSNQDAIFNSGCATSSRAKYLIPMAGFSCPPPYHLHHPAWIAIALAETKAITPNKQNPCRKKTAGAWLQFLYFC